MELLEWVAIGLCGHHEVCSTCMVRIHVFEHDRRCCICRRQCPTIVVTGAGRRRCVYAELASLVNMGRVEHKYDDLYSYHSISVAYFDDKQQFKDTRSVCSHLDDPDEAMSKRLVPRGDRRRPPLVEIRALVPVCNWHLHRSWNRCNASGTKALPL
jgi:hypothetical protein